MQINNNTSKNLTLIVTTECSCCKEQKDTKHLISPKHALCLFNKDVTVRSVVIKED